MNSLHKALFSLVILCGIAHGQQINLGTQVKGLLPPTNGGTGVNSSGVTGCPLVTAGVWTFPACSSPSGGSPSGSNFAIQYANGLNFGGVNFSGFVFNNGSTQPPTAATQAQLDTLLGGTPCFAGAACSVSNLTDTSLTSGDLVLAGAGGLLGNGPAVASLALLNAQNVFTGATNTFQSIQAVQLFAGNTGAQEAFLGSAGAQGNNSSGALTWSITNSSGVGFFQQAEAATVTCLNANIASSINNQGGAICEWSGQYWNGTATATDLWKATQVLGTGTNPTTTLAYTHTGSTGAALISFPAISATTLAALGSVIDSPATSGFFGGLVGGSGGYILVASTATTDQKIFDAEKTSTGFTLRFVNDANTLTGPIMTVTQSGVTPTGITFGAATTVPSLAFSAGTIDTSSVAGAASALPTLPSGYLEVMINGNLRHVPFYN